MNRLRKLIPLALASLLRVLASLLSRLVPKDRRTWIIGSWDGHRFADNSKWLFLWYHAQPERLGTHTLTWISRSRDVVARVRSQGLPAEWLWSPKGFALSLRAGLHIVDADSRSTAPWSFRQAITVNLFHGIALKHIGADIEVPGSLYRAANRGSPSVRAVLRMLAPWFTEPYTVVVASSEANARVMASAFPAAGEVWTCGLPRNDCLLLDDASLGSHFRLRERPPYSSTARTVVYMPTFRDYDRSGRDIPLPWEQMEQLLEEHRARLILRLHVNDAARVPTLPAHSHISIHSSSEDPYLLLRRTDVLISDYSSVMFDFLLTDRPIILYCYDFEEYTRRARGLYYSIEDIAPGPLARNSNALLAHLADALTGAGRDYTDKRASLRQLLHSQRGFGSSAAVAARISHLLGEHSR